MRALLLATLVGLFCLLAPRPAAAHGMRTAYVDVTELGPGRAIVQVRSAVPGVLIEPVFDAPCHMARGDDGDGAEVVTCDGDLRDATVEARGLGPIVSDAVVWISFRDGTTASHLLTAETPRWKLPAGDRPTALAFDYVRLGVRHILTGADHLLFLLALVLCLRRPRAVIAAETAFTLSHTLSFSAAALGWVHVSPSAAEACIALSLVLIALDVPGRERLTLSRMHGPLLAFVFGLVHGLGFAGGLAEIGMPERGIPLALASFAVGIELGQVAFLAIVLLAVTLLARTKVLPRLSLAGAYAIGGIGVFWLLQRLIVCFVVNT